MANRSATASVAMLRVVYECSLVEAKEKLIVNDTGKTLDEHQAGLIDAVSQALEETNDPAEPPS